MPNNDDGDGDANGVFCVSVAVPHSMKLCTNRMEIERKIKMQKLCQTDLKLIQLTIYLPVVANALTLSWPSDMEVLENESENEINQLNICFKRFSTDCIGVKFPTIQFTFLLIKTINEKYLQIQAFTGETTPWA